MGSFLIKLIVNAVALWVTTLIVAGVRVDSYAPDTTAVVLTYLLISLIFGFVNGFIGGFVRIVAFPSTCSPSVCCRSSLTVCS